MSVAVVCANPDDPRSVLTTEAVNRAMAGIDVPADIPLDVWREAEAVWVALASTYPMGEVFSNIEVAARAVMAERERCASLAGSYYTSVIESDALAAAIRSGLTRPE